MLQPAGEFEASHRTGVHMLAWYARLCQSFVSLFASIDGVGVVVVVGMGLGTTAAYTSETRHGGFTAGLSRLTKQERLYLRRLMLDLQGSARSSLDFYRLGKVVGEGSFAQVSVEACSRCLACPPQQHGTGVARRC